jgi:hypothetical protein
LLKRKAEEAEDLLPHKAKRAPKPPKRKRSTGTTVYYEDEGKFEDVSSDDMETPCIKC